MEVQSETKLSDYGLIFALVFLTIAVITDSRILLLQKMEELNIWYDNAVDNAVEDAMEKIVELDDGETLTINKEEILERFFLGLSINLGLLEGDSAREQLECYFPVIAIMLEDGLYSWEVNETQEYKEFSKKIPYCFETENYKIYYTFHDTIIYYNKSTETESKGVYQNIRKIYPIKELSDENFDEIRRRTIISTITDTINSQLEKHNTFAAAYGIYYYFSLPVIDMEEWYRTIDDVTLLCIFQGYPYAIPQLGTFNKMVLSGARIHKAENIWEEREDTESGKDKLDGTEEFYITDSEVEDHFFTEIETKDLIEE